MGLKTSTYGRQETRIMKVKIGLSAHDLLSSTRYVAIACYQVLAAQFPSHKNNNKTGAINAKIKILITKRVYFGIFSSTGL